MAYRGNSFFGQSLCSLAYWDLETRCYHPARRSRLFDRLGFADSVPFTEKKITILSVLFLFLSFGAFAQINSQDEQAIRESLGKEKSISQNFTNGLINVGKLLGCDPGNTNKACEEVRDPWGGESKVVNWDEVAKIKDKEKVIAMQRLEDKIIMGEGGKLITKNIVFEAQKKHFGYKIDALKARYSMYLKSCCFEAWPSK